MAQSAHPNPWESCNLSFVGLRDYEQNGKLEKSIFLTLSGLKPRRFLAHPASRKPSCPYSQSPTGTRAISKPNIRHVVDQMSSQFTVIPRGHLSPSFQVLYRKCLSSVFLPFPYVPARPAVRCCLSCFNSSVHAQSVR